MTNYYQLHVRFETADAMGANFINSCLEQLAQTLQNEATIYPHFSETEKQIEGDEDLIEQCLVAA